MPKSRAKQARRPATRKAGARPTRPAKSGKPANNAARRKKRTAQRQQRTPAMPGWRDLATSNERVQPRPRPAALIDKVPTVRFALLLLLLAAGITLYVGHVQATQDALAQVQQARRENLRLHLKLNRLKGDFDRATGPAVIYERARALGLEEGIAYGPTIRETDQR